MSLKKRVWNFGRLLASSLAVLTATGNFCLQTASANEKTIRVESGRVRKIDLGEAPKSIEVVNPEILDVERVGLSNTIQLIGRRGGRTSLIVRYPRGSESVFHVSVGGGEFGSDAGLSSAGLMRMAKEIQRIGGFDASIDDGKVLISGSLTKIESFRQLVKVVAPRAAMFVPAYSVHPSVEEAVLKSLREDLTYLGENKLALISRGGLFMISGVASSPENKVRALNFINALVPNLMDATDSVTGHSDIVQINVQFLEVGKSNQNEFGFKHPGSNAPVSGSLAFKAGDVTAAVVAPTFQIASMTSMFRALRQRSQSRELASPVIITRSNERASFLAGGEIPLSMTTEKGPKIEFKPYGISLAVTPKIQNDGAIWLALDMEVSSVQNDLVINGNPAFLSRRMNTNVVLQEGNVAVLSGLVRANDAKAVEKFPILGSIPIIGELFKSRKFTDAESELWIAVTAQTGERAMKDKNLKKQYDEFGRETQGSLLD